MKSSYQKLKDKVEDQKEYIQKLEKMITSDDKIELMRVKMWDEFKRRSSDLAWRVI